MIVIGYWIIFIDYKYFTQEKIIEIKTFNTDSWRVTHFSTQKTHLWFWVSIIWQLGSNLFSIFHDKSIIFLPIYDTLCLFELEWYKIGKSCGFSIIFLSVLSCLIFWSRWLTILVLFSGIFTFQKIKPRMKGRRMIDDERTSFLSVSHKNSSIT